MTGKAAALFVKQREQYLGRDYLYYTVTYHLAPVLEIHRPAVMLSFSDDRRRLFTLWEGNKLLFFTRGKLAFCELKRTEKRVFILFYHRQLLDLIMGCEAIRSFLQKFGYGEQMTLADRLAHLQKRFRQVGCPPELGAFLGIPLADIEGFITHKGKNYKARGSWKVYADTQKAQQLFSRCEEAQFRFLGFIQRGYPPADYLLIHA